ncbi:hypothetical protein [Robertkochia sediminum]|uniref:hypothetical protein n=1 Tax=Robertkochia sediminum TaxID=2785326 RepID=UPI001932152A|nr:hypothetical protein [Robertkochia sediminum]MBL7473624.1 hypothetical protein [Robertkochia sediminum]
MKRILSILVMVACTAALAQEQTPTVVFDQIMVTPHPEKVMQFHKAVAEHNKQFHTDAPRQVAVYQIMTGPNTGKYIWNLGPCTWQELDERPMDTGHNEHWVNNVTPTLTTEAHGTFWQYHPEFSNISNNFKLNMLSITFYDVKRGIGNFDKIKAVMERFTQLYREKYPEDMFGIYTNVMGSTKEGRDLAIVGFLNNYADMASENPDVPEKYDAMFGKESYEKDLQTWMENMEGSASEMWLFMPELSSRPAEVEVAQN